MNRSGSSVVRRPISGSFATSRSGGAAWFQAFQAPRRAGRTDPAAAPPTQRPFAQREVGEAQVELAVLDETQQVGG